MAAKPTGPFDAKLFPALSFLRILKKRLDKPDEDGNISHTFHLGQNDRPGIELAICVLTEWPKWAKLIEAAGKVDKEECMDVFDLFMKNTKMGQYDDIRYRKDGLAIFPIAQLRALIESLPEKEGEGE